MGGAREALELQVDQKLRGGEEEVEGQRATCERGAEDEGAEEPEEGVDGEGEVEGCIQAAGVGGGEGFGGFLVTVSVCKAGSE